MIALAATTKRLLVHLRPHHRYSLRHLCSSGKDHITSQSIIGESTDSDTTLPFSICANETKENQVKDGNNFVGEKLMSPRINNRELKAAENYKSWGRKRAYFVSSRELHSGTRQVTTKENKSMADNLEHLLCDLKRNKTLMAENLAHIKELECKKDKSMADNSMLFEELESLLWDVDGNETLMAENLAHIKELECKNEVLMADNLEHVKKLDFSLGFNLLDEYVARNLEVARNLDPSKINGNEDLMAIIKELFTRLKFAFKKVEKDFELMPDYMELVKELNCVSEKNDANDEDNLALVKSFGLALWKINSNNKLMTYNLELVKILESILEKSDAEDKLMASMGPYSSHNVNKGLMVKNLEILRELDSGFEKIDVNDNWMADNLELIRKLEFVIGKINANDPLIKENLEILKLCHDQADNLERVRKSVVAIAKINENEAWLADIRKSQVDLAKMNTSDLLVVGYSELVKMLVRPW